MNNTIENALNSPVCTIAKYLNQFCKEKGENKGQLIFRGQANKKWNVGSSAARRLSDDMKRENNDSKRKLLETKKIIVTQSDFIDYHVNLIANARNFGYAELKANSNLSDIELLAEIQHYGGATCLVDFTTNFLIALWMASQTSVKKESNNTYTKETDGKIFWLDLGEEKNIENICYCNSEEKDYKIKDLLTKIEWNFDLPQHKIEPCFWLWEPTKLNDRIIMQDSIFLFGSAAFPSVAQNIPKKIGQKKIALRQEARIAFKAMIIDKGDKKLIRKELEQFFGINAETVYYDLHGYAFDANHTSKPVSQKIISKSECIYAAKDFTKKGQYSQALKLLDQALECSKSINIKVCPRYLEDKCNGISNMLGEILYWKANTLKTIEGRDQALLYYYQAKNWFSKDIMSDKEQEGQDYKFKILCEICRNISMLLYQKQDYHEAEKIDRELYNLYTIHQNRYKDETSSNYLNGADGAFALFELMILQLREDDILIGEESVRTICKKISSDKHNNSTILNIFLDAFYKLLKNEPEELSYEVNLVPIFEKINNEIKLIKNRIKNDKNKKTKTVCLINYFHWNYDDIVKWIENIRNIDDINDINDSMKRKVFQNANVLILLTQKAKDAQSKLLDIMFEESKTMSDS